MKIVSEIYNFLELCHEEFPTLSGNQRHNLTVNFHTKKLELTLFIIELTLLAEGKWYSFFLDQEDFEDTNRTIKAMRIHIDDHYAQEKIEDENKTK